MQKQFVVLALIGLICISLSGTVYGGSSKYGCSNCHTPHWAGDPDDPTVYGVPLWSNAQLEDGIPVYDLYSSKKFDALETDISQPEGATKLCLGCHDGTYSHVDSEEATFVGDALERSHPVSFTYDTALADKVGEGLYDPSTTDSGLGGTISDDLLDIKEKLQCSSCHSPHVGAFEHDLKYESVTTLCKTCHNK